jgi:ABC-type arginine/histidine transport system permease subunit
LGCFSAAYLALAIAILYDKNEIFPRWFAYVSIWQIVTEVIATQMFVFSSGPFAWNGSIAFWWSVVVFSVWLCALIALLKKATAREPADSPALD